MDRRTEFIESCLILDTETTSKNFNEAEVTELGYIVPNQGGYESFVDLFSTHEPISPEVSAVTNITNKMVAGKPLFEDSLETITAVMSFYKTRPEGAACVAHNSFYDMKVLSRYNVEFPTWLCTMRIAKKLYGNDNSVTAFNLPYLRYRFGVLDPADHELANAHRADADALVTTHLLMLFVDEMVKTGILNEQSTYLSQLIDWIEEPIVFETMPFGKHKGMPMEDVPVSYWKWAILNMDSLDESKENFDKDFAASVFALESVQKLAG